MSIYANTPAPNPPPTPSSTSHIVVSDGDCDVVDYCVHAQIIHQIMDQIRHVTFVSEGMACFSWSIFAIENSLDDLILAGDTNTESTNMSFL